MQQFGTGLWLADGPCVSVAGFHYPTRMAVIALAEGLLVWSPIALSADLRSAVDALGEVCEIVAPNHLHHLALAEWAAAYPKARLHAAPRLGQKRRDLRFRAVLGGVADPAWADRVEQVIFPTLITDEVVFLHRPSGTVLFCDLLQQFPADWFRGWRRVVAGLDGMVGAAPQVPRKFRLATVQRKAARAALARVKGWQADQLVMAHGQPLRAGGKAVVDQAFRWL